MQTTKTKIWVVRKETNELFGRLRFRNRNRPTNLLVFFLVLVGNFYTHVYLLLEISVLMFTYFEVQIFWKLQ